MRFLPLIFLLEMDMYPIKLITMPTIIFIFLFIICFIPKNFERVKGSYVDIVLKGGERISNLLLLLLK